MRAAYSGRYIEAADVAVTLALGGLCLGVYYIYVSGLFFFKKNTMVPVVTVVSGTINIVLNLFWIPSYGLLGAAWATLVSYLCLTHLECAGPVEG